MRYEFSDFKKIKCNLFLWEGFFALYNTTNGNPCKDCGSNTLGNKCDGYEELKKANKSFAKKVYSETNAKAAERLGITKRQVSKMRKKGEL